MKKNEMIKLKFNRDSVCMADDMEDHAVFFDVDEKISVDDLVQFLYSKPNVIPGISGGKATWILQIKNGHFYRDIAVFAEQWDSVKYISNTGLFTSIGEIISFYNPTEFFARYLGQKDPEDIYNIFKELRF